MIVIQRPRAKEFCATMQDYIIDTDISISFSVQYGGKTILEERYVPDANNQVRIRNLGKFCELSLWGVWCLDYSPQNSSSGTFSFFINEILDMDCYVMFSPMHTKKNAETPGVLSEVSMKITHLGSQEFISGYLLQDPESLKEYGVNIIGYWPDDSEETLFMTIASTAGGIVSPITINVSADIISSKFERPGLSSYQIELRGGAMKFYVDSSQYLNQWCFRYKNVYDMPETLTATGELKLSGNNESDDAAMYGISRKFGVKVSDEYTMKSGTIILQSDYKLWHNLLNAQEVELMVNNTWLPVIVTKQKFEREFRKSILKEVEFNFKMANHEQNNMIDL